MEPHRPSSPLSSGCPHPRGLPSSHSSPRLGEGMGKGGQAERGGCGRLSLSPLRPPDSCPDRLGRESGQAVSSGPRGAGGPPAALESQIPEVHDSQRWLVLSAPWMKQQETEAQRVDRVHPSGRRRQAEQGSAEPSASHSGPGSRVSVPSLGLWPAQPGLQFLHHAGVCKAKPVSKGLSPSWHWGPFRPREAWLWGFLWVEKSLLRG